MQQFEHISTAVGP